jgi:hypothetical protein
MNFIMENKGVIAVVSGTTFIEFSVEDFARFFTSRNCSEYWQFPTKWKKAASSTVVSGVFIYYPGTETLEDFIRERAHQCKFKNTDKKPRYCITQSIKSGLL